MSGTGDYGATNQPVYEPPERPGGASAGRPPRSGSGIVGWVVAAAVVLILAVAGGLLTAWLVANMRAVPGPVAGASPTPVSRPSAVASGTPAPSATGSDGPRRTPTVPPTPEVTLPPLVHTVGPGESLTYIANLYGVTVDDILALNDIANPNRIQVGQEILIPGYGAAPTRRPRR